jgi:hypothetical protein
LRIPALFLLDVLSVLDLLGVELPSYSGIRADFIPSKFPGQLKTLLPFFSGVRFLMFLMSGPFVTGMLQRGIPECFCAPPAPSPQGL